MAIPTYEKLLRPTLNWPPVSRSTEASNESACGRGRQRLVATRDQIDFEKLRTGHGQPPRFLDETFARTAHAENWDDVNIAFRRLDQKITHASLPELFPPGSRIPPVLFPLRGHEKTQLIVSGHVSQRVQSSDHAGAIC